MLHGLVTTPLTTGISNTLPFPIITYLPDLRQDLWTYHVACEQTGEHCLLSQGPIVRYRFCQPWHVPCFDLLIGNISCMHVIWPCSAKHLSCFGEPLISIIGRSGYVALKELNQKGHSKLVDLLVNRVWSLCTPTNYPYHD